ncbi:MAG: M3 family oligoendopeptidase, partial [Methylocystis sp.]
MERVASPLVGSNNLATSDSDALPEWNLSDLYVGPNAPELQADLTRLVTEVEQFNKEYRGRLSGLIIEPQASILFGVALEKYETIQDLLGRLMSYAGLLYSADTTDPQRTKFYGDIQEKVTNASAQLIFFQLELNRLDSSSLMKVAQSAPLSRWKPWLEDIRKEKPHELDEKLEELFHEKYISGAAAWNRLFDETIASLRFNISDTKLTIEPALNLLQDSDEGKRREAAVEIGRTLKENLSIFTLITNTLAKDKEISDRWRGFQDVADARHLSNRVERNVVEALAKAVEESQPRLSHRYYKLKAKWLGKDKLDYWDRGAPLPSTPSKNYRWSEARDLVLEAYNGFSPRMAEIASNFFERNWIDAPVRPGKSPGAFSHPTVPSAHPYVLLNYQGKTRDVMTLAHELGHGVHQVLAARQGALMAPTPLTLAETASVFGEMLTFRALLAKTSDKMQRRALLASKVEDMLNTVVR